METVFYLSEVVCATLKSQDFLESIIPMISEKVIESIILVSTLYNFSCRDLITLFCLLISISLWVIASWHCLTFSKCGWFHNVKVPTNRKGEIIQPVDTYSIVLGICNKDLGLKLDINHIGRSHPIGEPKDGKIAYECIFPVLRRVLRRFIRSYLCLVKFSAMNILSGLPFNFF
jgi:hypothetical protein